MNCIHQQKGLCPDCQEAYNAEPESWLEFGEHEEGIKNWEALKEEMRTWQKDWQFENDVGEDIPF